MENKFKLTKTTDVETKYDIITIEPESIEGVNIPCVLAIPENYAGKGKITLCFNNEDGSTLNESCKFIQKDILELIKKVDLQGPILVPILPSKKEFDKALQEEGIDFLGGEPKQFARECFDSVIPEKSVFYRIDEQVVSIIENITSNSELTTKIQELRGKEESLEFDERLIGFGHSGGGAAMLRFALIHPEQFETLIIGGNGDIVPTPLGENGESLGYPFGVKDYYELFGRKFLKEDYKRINFQFYIGDREDIKTVHDTIRDENYEEGKTGPVFAPKELASLYKSMYGTPFFERFKNVLNQYEIAGAIIGLKIYENDCHSMITAEDFHGIIDNGQFFDSNCSAQIQSLLDKRKMKNGQVLGQESLEEQKDVVALDEIQSEEHKDEPTKDAQQKSTDEE